jgi:peptide chain release factor subunit 3
VIRGNVLCHRNDMMPVTEIFEAEVDILDLLEYKPILSKGYTCIMHIHTFNDEVIIKEILKTQEPSDKGEDIIRDKPLFARG